MRVCVRVCVCGTAKTKGKADAFDPVSHAWPLGGHVGHQGSLLTAPPLSLNSVYTNRTLAG